MDIPPRSPFSTLEICFRLLGTGPACLALDGRHLGHGLPARPIPLGELRVLLQHPAVTSDLQRAGLQELIHRAAGHGGRWLVALAGVLLPGLRRIAASVACVDQGAADHVEADLLQVLRDVIGQHGSQAREFTLEVFQATPPRRPSLPPAMGRGHPLGHENDHPGAPATSSLDDIASSSESAAISRLLTALRHLSGSSSCDLPGGYRAAAQEVRRQAHSMPTSALRASVQRTLRLLETRPPVATPKRMRLAGDDWARCCRSVQSPTTGSRDCKHGNGNLVGSATCRPTRPWTPRSRRARTSVGG